MSFLPWIAGSPAPADLRSAGLIKVVGVGGAGCNAVDRMIRDAIAGVEFIALNTDAQALGASLAPQRLLLGPTTCNGRGCGMRPEIGRLAASESRAEIAALLHGADLIFIAAGMGGGTGTGAAPIVAEIAREQGALVVGVVTKPFSFEGGQRQRLAEVGCDAMLNTVDTLVSVTNDRLLNEVANQKSFREALAIADLTLRNGVRGISDLIVNPGMINIDLADVRTILQAGGNALMGMGRARSEPGQGRALAALEMALASPLLDLELGEAHGILLNITCGEDLLLEEFEAIGNRLAAVFADETQRIIGTTIDRAYWDGWLKITLIATGFPKTPSKLAPIRRGKFDLRSHLLAPPAPAAPLAQAASAQPARLRRIASASTR